MSTHLPDSVYVTHTLTGFCIISVVQNVEHMDKQYQYTIQATVMRF